MTGDGPGEEDLPQWPDDLVVPDDLSGLFGDDAGGQETGGDGPAGSDVAGSDPAGSDVAGNDTAGSDVVGSDTADDGDAHPGEDEEQVSDQVVRTTAVVLTNVRQAKVLAGLMALAGIDAAVVPSRRGAIAVRYVEQEAEQVDPAEALSGIPREAEGLGAALSMATRSEVVLLAARVQSVEGEIAGQVKARRYRGGRIAEDPPPGLVLAQADAIAERLLIGLVQAPQVPGYISSTDLRSGGGRSGRSLFGRRNREDQE